MKIKHKIAIAFAVTSVFAAIIVISSLLSIQSRYQLEVENRNFTATKTFIINNGLVSSNENFNLSAFVAWAQQHSIKIAGTNKTSGDMYLEGFNSTVDNVDLTDVGGLQYVESALHKLPDNVLKVMSGKTIYVSNKFGRSYTVLGGWPQDKVLVGVDRGFILEQDISEEETIHEFGHIVDYHGIQGFYHDKNNYFKYAASDRNRIFAAYVPYNPDAETPPKGYITVYSTANTAENFAEHFMAYVLDAKEFRTLAQNDTLLAAKYNFFKNEIFNGTEY